jgi:hypothetical protein
MGPVGWGLICYDFVTFLVLLWLWVHGYVDGVWDCGRRARAERREAARWWADREGGEMESEMLYRDEVLHERMRRMGMA